MLQPYPDNRFPPIIKGSISEIYPWIECGQDHLDFLKYSISNILKINSNISNDRIIQNFFNCPNIFLVDSGRSALVIALQSLEIKPDDEVLISAFNCPAVAEAIIQTGASIKFTELNQDGSLNLDAVKRDIGPKTKGLIVTHVYGLVDDLKQLSDICNDQGIFLINDLAQTLENPDSNKKLNLYGDMSIYSFGPEKHLFSLGGGGLITHKEDLKIVIKKNLPVKTFSLLSVFLILTGRWKYFFTFFISKNIPVLRRLLADLHLIYSFTGNKMPESLRITTPRLMHPLQKSILARKIQKYNLYLSRTIENFNEIKKQFNTRLLDADESLPLYATLRVDAKGRFAMSEYLSRHGIQTVWNYLPLYKTPGIGQAALPMTESLWQEVLSIPFRYPMTIDRVKQVCEIIKSYFNHADPRN